MPVRDRQQARVLNLCLSIAAAVTFTVTATTANATPISRQQPTNTSPSSPGKATNKTTTSTTTTTTSTAPRQMCANAAVPPPGDDGPGDPMPPLDVPEDPVGGGKMGECGLVLPANAAIPPDKLTAASWVIADQDTGDVLAAYAPHARQRPAGTVKVLLAMVALRDIPPDTIIVGTKEDTKQKLTTIGIVADGKYTAQDLIRALIVTSAADVANALARTLGGPAEAVKKMNDLAAELKALDTRVVNPYGIDAPGMSTSAFDAAVIYREAMRNAEFADATGSTEVSIQPQGKRNTQINRSNDNTLLRTFKGATGGKSSMTTAAKYTFVGGAERNGKRVLVSVLRSEKSPFDQAASLMEYGFGLTAAHVQSIGQLGKTAEPSQVARDTNVQNNAERNAAVTSTTALQRSAFGNFGLPVTIAAGVVILLGLVLTMRRKMARARRLRAQTR